MHSKCILNRFLISLLLINNSSCAEIFTKLDSIEQYAKQLNEYPDADNITQLLDWLDPEYRSFNEKRYPGFFSRLLTKIGIKRPAWTIEGFKELLTTVTNQRQSHGIKGRFIQKFTPSSDDRFFIWGNLHGAFHSLVRDLAELKKQGIIDNSLKIINNHHYFVFIGNVICRSPFILETLTVVLRIMHMNKTRVFYVKGDHEDHDKWTDFTLADELKIRGTHISNEKIPLHTEINLFFDTLPLALYLVSSKNSEIDLVRISNAGLDNKELQEKYFSNFFVSSPDNTLHNLGQENEQISDKKVVLRAIIRTKSWPLAFLQKESWGPEVHPYGGLQFLGISNNILEWAVLSANTNTTRRLFNFHYDSFVELVTKYGVNSWEIAVYNRNSKQSKSPLRKNILSLISGQKPPTAKKEEVSLKKLTVGTTLDLSGVYKREGARFKDGIMLAFDEINKAGGINGRLLELVFLDDGYNADKAHDNVTSLLKQGIDIILASFGTPVLKGYIDMIKNKKVISLFPSTGEMVARQPDLKYIINFIPPYKAEGYLLATYALDVLKTRKIVFYYNPAATDDIEAATEKLKPADVLLKKIPYISENDVNKEESLSKVVQIITKENPDTILFTSPPTAARELIEKLGLSWIKDKYLLGMSDYSEIIFLNFIKAKGLSFVYTSYFPDPEKSQLPIVQQFNRVTQEMGPPLSFEIFNGYVSAKLFAYILKQINDPITIEKIIDVAEKMKNVNFEGLILNFDPQLRQLSHVLWIDRGRGKRDEYHVTSKNGEISVTKVGATD